MSYGIQVDSAWPSDYPSGCGVYLVGDSTYTWFPYGGVFIQAAPGIDGLDIQQNPWNSPRVYFYPAMAAPKTTITPGWQDYSTASANLATIQAQDADIANQAAAAGRYTFPKQTISLKTTLHDLESGGGGDIFLSPEFDIIPDDQHTVVEVVGTVDGIDRVTFTNYYAPAILAVAIGTTLVIVHVPPTVLLAVGVAAMAVGGVIGLSQLNSNVQQQNQLNTYRRTSGGLIVQP